jgi:predicted Zn-dependent protease
MAEALEHLEAAARLTPDAANVRYQLAQAYLKAGRTEQAARELDAYRQLKDKQRERGR